MVKFESQTRAISMGYSARRKFWMFNMAITTLNLSAICRCLLGVRDIEKYEVEKNY